MIPGRRSAISRRSFVKSGLSAVALGLLGHRAWAGRPASIANVRPRRKSGAFAFLPPAPESTVVDGLPFAAWFTGDDFENQHVPFHSCENCFKDGGPPAPTEEIGVAVVGGGISGLATAYLLRHYNPVLFELHDHVGGSAQGEVWAGTPYSFGNAYVITPDPGSFLERFYRELGLDEVVRVHSGEDIYELNGEILTGFWSGQGFDPEDLPALQRYAEVVANMAENDYPEIPLQEGKDNAWILKLDQVSLRQDIETQMGMPVPPLLAAAVQSYCYSSFAAGWEEISAAGGWNFLAAEEYGRWVFPGATAYMADALWKRLHALDRQTPLESGAPHVRTGCMVVDVRLTAAGRAQVTYLDARRRARSLLAERVVMGIPKHVVRQVLHDFRTLDPDKYDATYQIATRAYLVANVLLNAPVELDFYDVFLLGDGDFPMNEGEAEAHSRVVDMLNGHYARPQSVPRSVLTLYWPLPYVSGRFQLLFPNGWSDFASALAAQVRQMLQMLGVPESAVAQIRMTRWGHAMPVNAPGLIADGTTELLRRPIDDRIFFVNQDNWALPAVENCLLDAEAFVPQITAGLEPAARRA